MDFNSMAMRVAGLSQPLSDRPDYEGAPTPERSASYLDPKVEIPHPERLADWAKTSEGRDLTHLISELSKLTMQKPGDAARIKKDGPKLPHILQKISNSALEILDYIKS